MSTHIIGITIIYKLCKKNLIIAIRTAYTLINNSVF